MHRGGDRNRRHGAVNKNQFSSEVITKYFLRIPVNEPEVVKKIEEDDEDDYLGDDESNVFGYAKLKKEKERQKLVMHHDLIVLFYSFYQFQKATRKDMEETEEELLGPKKAYRPQKQRESVPSIVEV